MAEFHTTGDHIDQEYLAKALETAAQQVRDGEYVAFYLVMFSDEATLHRASSADDGFDGVVAYLRNAISHFLGSLKIDA